MSLSKTLYSPRVLVIPRKQWLCPDMTEKLVTGMLYLNTNKQDLTDVDLVIGIWHDTFYHNLNQTLMKLVFSSISGRACVVGLVGQQLIKGLGCIQFSA